MGVQITKNPDGAVAQAPGNNLEMDPGQLDRIEVELSGSPDASGESRPPAPDREWPANPVIVVAGAQLRGIEAAGMWHTGNVVSLVRDMLGGHYQAPVAPPVEPATEASATPTQAPCPGCVHGG